MTQPLEQNTGASLHERDNIPPVAPNISSEETSDNIISGAQTQTERKTKQLLFADGDVPLKTQGIALRNSSGESLLHELIECAVSNKIVTLTPQNFSEVQRLWEGILMVHFFEKGEASSTVSHHVHDSVKKLSESGTTKNEEYSVPILIADFDITQDKKGIEQLTDVEFQNKSSIASRVFMGDKRHFPDIVLYADGRVLHQESVLSVEKALAHTYNDTHVAKITEGIATDAQALQSVVRATADMLVDQRENGIPQEPTSFDKLGTKPITIKGISNFVMDKTIHTVRDVVDEANPSIGKLKTQGVSLEGLKGDELKNKLLECHENGLMVTLTKKNLKEVQKAWDEQGPIVIHFYKTTDKDCQHGMVQETIKRTAEDFKSEKGKLLFADYDDTTESKIWNRHELEKLTGVEFDHKTGLSIIAWIGNRINHTPIHFPDVVVFDTGVPIKKYNVYVDGDTITNEEKLKQSLQHITHTRHTLTQADQQKAVDETNRHLEYVTDCLETGDAELAGA